MDVLEFTTNGSWKTLECLAQKLATDAQERAGVKFEPKLGGGTRLMLDLHHRISHDIDLFIRDPQWIGYLSPRLNDRFDNEIAGYEENAVSLKLRHAAGEIDFIVAMSLLGLPDEHSPDWWAIETIKPHSVPHEKRRAPGNKTQ